MPSQVEIDLRETVTRLKKLPEDLAGKNGGPIRSALFQGGKIMRDDIKRRAHKGTGTPLPGRLIANIVMPRDKNPRSLPGRPTEAYHITVRGGWKEGAAARKRTRTQVYKAGGSAGAAFAIASKLTAKDAYYWIYEEFGTDKRPKHPFLRPGFEATKHLSVTKFGQVLNTAVDKIERAGPSRKSGRSRAKFKGRL